VTSVPEAKLWYCADIDAEFFTGRFGDFSYDVHTHDTACLALITKGTIEIRMKGSQFVAVAGDLYAIDPDEPHAGWPVDRLGWEQRTIYADLALLRRHIDEDQVDRASPHLQGPIIRDPALTSAFLTTHRLSETTRDSLQRDENFLVFVDRLLCRHSIEQPRRSPVGSEPQAVRQAREFLDEHLGTRVSLTEIATACGISEFRLYRSFEREIGMTPHAYQRQARIRAAMRLIRSGYDLADVAITVGFADQAHMTRSFKARMSFTPGAYRAARSAGRAAI
jgi:AraC-like DNA-binding protein